ncbi:octaheme c-type cytochrome, tetrathionate reductase family [Maridesulfovibrio ferrireducens]|uniref:Octaheme c-type cytochrome, tetrathionate reductase family n=1 Tax=Maridesulfovibrio ferrireducens TaxID=246191 RepID=A0A1G9G0N8_9BACT|nr:tetrathionate reductase family octaheme c-type cytochrome [Maridesulfovibrio ferrireducens]SDK94199.1 octaheme c-type cytochrome, tetrathionate reductase family [Maridesulfovibrio ferrireducens]
MRFIRRSVLALVAVVFLCGPAFGAGDDAPGIEMARQATKGKELWITADHSKFDALKQPFKSGPEVTKACLTCHTEAGHQFHKTIHWTWLDPKAEKEMGIGKGGLVVNNFCISIQSNEPRCTSCHAGYGWKNKDFDFKSEEKIDCLVCHEQTGTYKKFPAGAGNPAPAPGKLFKGNGKFYKSPEWNKVAQSVSRPTRANCGTCHFYGGGGDGVKHGDLDSSMRMPSKNLDVHMSTKGQNFECSRCHTTVKHQIAGRIYSNPAAVDRKSLLEDDLGAKIMCESCHSATPHKSEIGMKLNDHTDKVACQSCHIPTFARELPTKMWWDWSQAGKMKDGKPYVVKGEWGKPTYMSKKGDMRWEKNVIPEYYWFNGTIESITAKTIIDPGASVKVSRPIGSSKDHKSRIMPFKVHRGKTPYDVVNKNMVIPHLFGKDKAAYWKGYDWTKATAAGMAYAGLPFSGDVGFVDTEYVYPITHMVAPKDNVLACEACHSKQSRLSSLTSFYMPGRDANRVVDAGGWFIVIASVVGVVLHALGRIFIKGRKED